MQEYAPLGEARRLGCPRAQRGRLLDRRHIAVLRAQRPPRDFALELVEIGLALELLEEPVVVRVAGADAGALAECRGDWARPVAVRHRSGRDRVLGAEALLLEEVLEAPERAALLRAPRLVDGGDQIVVVLVRETEFALEVIVETLRRPRR